MVLKNEKLLTELALPNNAPSSIINTWDILSARRKYREDLISTSPFSKVTVLLKPDPTEVPIHLNHFKKDIQKEKQLHYFKLFVEANIVPTGKKIGKSHYFIPTIRRFSPPNKL